ncbi:MAG: response regulator [Caldithrix sp.]|nr:response regulator [Caldithrix sp.]
MKKAEYFLPVMLLLLNFFAYTGQTSANRSSSILKAKMDVDGDYIPDRLNQFVEVKGVATVPSGLLDSSKFSIFIQDQYGGIEIFNNKIVEPVQFGDSIFAAGRLKIYEGVTYVDSAQYEVIASGSTSVKPLKVDLKKAHLEDYESRLITVTGHVISKWEDYYGGYFTIKGANTKEDKGEVTVFWDKDYLRQSHLSKFSVGDRLQITGILGQYDLRQPYDSNYEIYPLNENSVKIRGLPANIRQRLLTIVIAMMVLILIIVITMYVVLRRTNKKLKDSEEKYRIILNAMSNMVILLNRDGKILEVKNEQYYDCEPKESTLTGKSIEDCMLPWVVEDIKYAIANHQSKEIEFEMNNDSGKRFYYLTLTPASKTRYICIVQDITEQKEYMERMRKAKETALEASKLKSNFLANMSHEIRTPMNGILGMAQLLLNTELQEDQKENVKMILASGNSLLTIINDILDFSKIESGKMELSPYSFSLRDSLEESFKPMHVRFQQKKLKLIVRIDNSIPDKLIGDYGRLRQILLNLIGNAMKFTEEGGVLIELTRKTFPSTDSKIWIQFVVSDTGIGISEDKLESVFESFKQADSSTVRRFGGTGLGLTISKYLVEMMGGKITVNSPSSLNKELGKGGKGSQFQFVLPLDVEEEQNVPDHESDSDIDVESLPVLIISDKEKTVRPLQKLFIQWKMRPSFVKPSEPFTERLQRAEQDGQPYKLVIVDGQDNFVETYFLIYKIREELPATNTKIILLLSTIDKKTIKQLDEMNIDAFFPKPINEENLYNLIVDLLSGRKIKPQPVQLHDKDLDKSDKQETADDSDLPKKILLAEDNSINRKVAVRALEQNGFEVDVAEDGLIAYKKFLANTYGLVLMDLQMPEMDGYTATKKIRQYEQEQNKQRTPIVALTAHAMKGEREKCLMQGMDDYTSKPFKIETLIETIRNAMQENDS